MGNEMQIVLAGFGGQGVLFAGKVIAYSGLIDGREVSWLPSYGPEMRGGTANCSVTLSDEAIGSPLVTNPDVLIALNQPSFDKFIDLVKPGGKVFADASMITEIKEREDVGIFPIEATRLAEDAGLKGAANLVMIGKMFKETAFCTPDVLDAAVVKCVPASKAALLDKNRKAIEIGMEA